MKQYQLFLNSPEICFIWNKAEMLLILQSVNAALAEKLIAERNKEYQTTKRISKSLEQITRGLNRQAVSVPPRGTTAEMKQV